MYQDYQHHKSHNTAQTSVMSLESEKKNFSGQEEQVLQILKGNILNARQINKLMCEIKQLDNSSTHRAINGLVKRNLVVIDKRAKCPMTGKTVRFYKLPCETLF